MGMPKRTCGLIMAAACVAQAPYLLVPMGGDAAVHLVWIHCFAGQLWQGDPYPRWCFDADAGLGSPVFFFYFPLPYYLTSLLYPVTWLGVSIQQLYVLSTFAATVLSGITCWHWLRVPAGERCALAAAILYLFMPYHLELMFFRHAFAENWFLAFAPLMCLQARRLAFAPRLSAARVAGMAAAITVCLLCHVQATVGMLIGISIYMLATARRSTPLISMGAAAVIAAAACSFYLWPAWRYLPFVDPGANTLSPWANGTVSLTHFGHVQLRVLIGAIITAIGIATISVLAAARRQRLTDAAVRRECIAWALAAAAALFLMLPLSARIWAVINAAGPLAFPWRMQSVMMMALAYLCAVYMRFLPSARAQKTGSADYAVLLGFLLFFAFFVVQSRDVSHDEAFNRLIEARYVRPNEYRTRWTPPEYAGQEAYEYVLAQQRSRGQQALADVVEGKAEVTVMQWSWRGIALKVHAQTQAVIRLRHRFFPNWQAGYDHHAADLQPETGSGWMKVAVPPGDYVLTIKRTL